jgi:RNA polymerase sigma-70 factor (ECF subfamily)
MTNKEFEDKFLIHREILFNFLKYKYSLKNEEIEDIVQNTYIKIYKRFINSNLECEYPRQYLFNSACNMTIEYKTRKPYTRHEFTFTESNIDNQENFLDLVNEMDFSQIPEVLSEKTFISEELEILLNKLAIKNPEYSNILRMFYFDEMQANEISEKLNVPLNTIKTRLLRGRNKIKSFLNEDMVLSTL